MQGLGSDRTSITGVWEGVGSYFKREILTLVQRHCISHWLALVEKDSSTSAAYLEFFFFFFTFWTKWHAFMTTAHFEQLALKKYSKSLMI